MSTGIRKFFLPVLALWVLLIPASVMAQDKVQITVWLNDDDLGQCVADTVTSGFNASSQTSEVNVVLQPNVNDTLRTALSGGGGPDIVPIDGPATAQQIAKAGLLIPLDDYAAQLGWDEHFVPWALELGRVDGQLYTLPDSLETLVIWYNKTIFESNEWEVPVTMDELFTLSQTIEDAGIVPIGNAFSECPPCHEWFVGVFLNHYAGPEMVYEALTGQREWTDPVFVEAITKLNEMAQNGWFDGSLDLFFTDTFDTVHAMLGTGEAAMTIEGSWFNPSQYFGAEAGNENDYDWFPIPTTSGEETYMTGIGAVWGISANSQNPEAAAEYLTWSFSAEAQAERYIKCGFALAPVEVSPDAFTQGDPRSARIYSAYAQAAADGRYGYTTWGFFPGETNTYIWEQIQRVYLGEITPEEYVQGMQAVFERELAEGSVPPIPTR